MPCFHRHTRRTFRNMKTHCVLILSLWMEMETVQSDSRRNSLIDFYIHIHIYELNLDDILISAASGAHAWIPLFSSPRKNLLLHRNSFEIKNRGFKAGISSTRLTRHYVTEPVHYHTKDLQRQKMSNENALFAYAIDPFSADCTPCVIWCLCMCHCQTDL